MYNDILICDWIINSFIDYPGFISSVIYLKGCDLRCPYCQNPELVIDDNFSNNKSISGLIQQIEKRKNIIEGIVITGGEPTCYNRIQELINYIRTTLPHIKIKIDTNGLHPNIIKKLNIDYCALDLKAHPIDYNILGCKLSTQETEDRLLESIDIIRNLKENSEIRITAVKPFISLETIMYFNTILKNISKVYIQPFSNRKKTLNYYTSSFITPYPIPMEELKKYKNILSKTVNICEIRE